MNKKIPHPFYHSGIKKQFQRNVETGKNLHLDINITELIFNLSHMKMK